LKKLLRRFFTWAANKFTSKPDMRLIHESLTSLYKIILQRDGAKQNILETRAGKLLEFDAKTSRFIIFSDQHKGAGDWSDDFATNKDNYHAALEFYLEQGYTYINLGDCEELWENKPEPVLKLYANELRLEAAFAAANRYFKIFGNHDLLWFDNTAVKQYLSPFFGNNAEVLEGIVLQTTIEEKLLHIFLTHGHQGDKVSDSNAFSKWFVGRIWVPIQRWLEINVNTPATDFHLTDRHNLMMYEWTMQFRDVILVTGHTHKPVFESLDHIQRLNKQLEKAIELKDEAAIETINSEIQKRLTEYRRESNTRDNTHVIPSYYNSGCCCFSDGDITGIEIADGYMRLVKWCKKDGLPHREVKEESHIEHIAKSIS
jgi:predicted phosphodiesterase